MVCIAILEAGMLTPICWGMIASSGTVAGTLPQSYEFLILVEVDEAKVHHRRKDNQSAKTQECC